MVSSGTRTPTSIGAQQLTQIADNKKNQNIETQKINDYYNNITKTADAYNKELITVNSADDAKKAEVKNKRNEELNRIKAEADKIMNDSSLSSKEKVYKLGSLNSSTYGTISKAYADVNNMDAVYNLTDAINSVVNGSASIPTFLPVNASTTATITDTVSSTTSVADSNGSTSVAPKTSSPGMTQEAQGWVNSGSTTPADSPVAGFVEGVGTVMAGLSAAPFYMFGNGVTNKNNNFNGSTRNNR